MRDAARSAGWSRAAYVVSVLLVAIATRAPVPALAEPRTVVRIRVQGCNGHDLLSASALQKSLGVELGTYRIVRVDGAGEPGTSAGAGYDVRIRCRDAQFDARVTNEAGNRAQRSLELTDVAAGVRARTAAVTVAEAIHDLEHGRDEADPSTESPDEVDEHERAAESGAGVADSSTEPADEASGAHADKGAAHRTQSSSPGPRPDASRDTPKTSAGDPAAGSPDGERGGSQASGNDGAPDAPDERALGLTTPLVPGPSARTRASRRWHLAVDAGTRLFAASPTWAGMLGFRASWSWLRLGASAGVGSVGDELGRIVFGYVVGRPGLVLAQWGRQPVATVAAFGELGLGWIRALPDSQIGSADEHANLKFAAVGAGLEGALRWPVAGGYGLGLVARAGWTRGRDLVVRTTDDDMRQIGKAGGPWVALAASLSLP